MVFVPATAVGAVGTPENAGLTLLFCTKAVVASCVVLVELAAVGAVGVPAKAGLVVTKAVVANCVVFVPATAVGAVGTPENAGDILAFSTYCCDANAAQVLAVLYALITSVLELYQSCPKIGCVGAVSLAKFSNKYT